MLVLYDIAYKYKKWGIKSPYDNKTKDKVSSLMYGIYAIKMLEDEDRKRKRGGLANFVFIN